MRMMYPLLLTLLLSATGGGGVGANMNPRPYLISNGDASRAVPYSTTFDDSEFFDVYSPTIKTLYSQVYWILMDAVPLPDEIVERFKGKVMAMTGYEVDQVRELEDGTEVSVPITWAYNHHYMAWLNHHSEELETELIENHHNKTYQWGAQNNVENFSRSEFISEGNGGEFRSSYHGYPKGYAQLIWSPDTFRFNPMQIDTWNRTAMQNNSPFYHPGPLPKSSRIPYSAGYSGLIECPCSDRLEKEWAMTYGLFKEEEKCEGGDIQNASECLIAAKKVVPSNQYNTISKDDVGSAKNCSVTQHTDGSVDVLWNADIVVAEKREEESVVAFSSQQVNLTVVLNKVTATITMTGPNDRWFGAGFGSTSMCMHQVSDECPEGGPYAIVVSGDTVVERKLDQHGPGHVLKPSITVNSNQVVGSNRTVVLTRPLKGLTNEHFSFDERQRTVDIIAARGCGGLEFAQHCGHGSSTLFFIQTNYNTPLCRAGIQGTIGGQAFNNDRCADQPTGDLKKQKNPTCTVQSYRGGLSCCRHGQSLLDKDQEIPWKDQYLEYRFKYRFYFEEYTPATATEPASHQHLTRVYWTTEAFAGEYDIPQCSRGTPKDQCVHTITSHFKVRDAVWGDKEAEGIKLIYAGPHCHAPTCLSMDLYNADTGELLCHVEPVHSTTGELFNEKGFIAIPPCLWGSPEEGLVEPKFLSMTSTLMSIKRNNSTLPHTGEMASWQMRAVLVYKNESTTLVGGQESVLRRPVSTASTQKMLRALDPAHG